MRYLRSMITAKKGDSIMVEFDQPTRVLLLSDNQFKNYKKHKTYDYYGGHMEDSPHEFLVPRNGKWHVVVELGSYFDPLNIQASAKHVPKSYAAIDGEIIEDEAPEAEEGEEATVSDGADASYDDTTTSGFD